MSDDVIVNVVAIVTSLLAINGTVKRWNAGLKFMSTSLSNVFNVRFLNKMGNSWLYDDDPNVPNNLTMPFMSIAPTVVNPVMPIVPLNIPFVVVNISPDGWNVKAKSLLMASLKVL